jgi:hypothetical protein
MNQGESELALLNSIRMPVILSAPNPSLAAKLLGHILSIINPKIPLILVAMAVAAGIFLGDFVGEVPPDLPGTLFEGLAPTLFLVVVYEVEAVDLVVGDEPVDSYFLRAIFLLASYTKSTAY